MLNFNSTFWLLTSIFLVGCTERKTLPEQESQDSGLLDDQVNYPELPELDQYINANLGELQVPGLQAAVIKNGQVVWSKGYGLANTEEQRPVTTETAFMLASISKTVTAVAIMQLHERDLFQLDDDINDYLDFSVDHPSGKPITFRQLLTHTSGIRDEGTVFSSLYEVGDAEMTLREFVFAYFDPTGEYYDVEANFHDWEPGGPYDYSNFAVALIGYLVERISNQDFSQWCEEQVFEPLAMTQTGWHLRDFDEEMVANPHEQGAFGAGYVVVPHYGYPDYPDGQLRSSAQHMAKFLAMFANGGVYDGVRVLQEETVSLMSSVSPMGDGQGFIWYQFSLDNDTYMGHGGSDWGVGTRMGYRVSDGSGFIISLNAQPSSNSGFNDIQTELMSVVDNQL